MGVKVLGTKYSFWCERKIPGTNGTKREKYSGVNAPIANSKSAGLIIDDILPHRAISHTVTVISSLLK